MALPPFDSLHCSGLAAIAKSKLSPVVRYLVADVGAGTIELASNPNVTIERILDQAVDTITLRARAELGLLVSPDLAETLKEERAAAEAKAAAARAEAVVAELRWKERSEERRLKELQAEDNIAARVTAGILKKTRELDRKISSADRRIARALEGARDAVRAELVVVRAVCAWLRGWLEMELDDSAKRFRLIELDLETA